MMLFLHDAKNSEITVDLLRDKITAAIEDVKNQIELKRLVILFFGHGAALAIGDQYWILTSSGLSRIKIRPRFLTL
jgi:hypothetical protein